MKQSYHIAVIGLGYVGLPVACAFAQKFPVIGFDTSLQRIDELKMGYDKTNEISAEILQKNQIQFSADSALLASANFYIITVPTPIDKAKRPDLSHLHSATDTVARYLKPGDIVVYESTVFPGATEEECLPILEKISGMKGGTNFHIGYSPERINPGDKEHTFTKVLKIVSGDTPESLNQIAEVYGSVVDAGVYRASSIKVAEAAKVIENTQRDINIALMNELAIICHKLNIKTHDVLDAAGTKWNFLPFKPGLVGGHCIGVDPYYLTYKAQQLNYHPEVILAGRRINDSMGHYIAEQTVLRMIRAGSSINGRNAIILGLTFKENCYDIRNTKVVDIIEGLKNYGLNVEIHDPFADPQDVLQHYHLRLTAWDDLKAADLVILAVAHDIFKKLEITDITQRLTPHGIIIDLKNMLAGKANNDCLEIWSL